MNNLKFSRNTENLPKIEICSNNKSKDKVKNKMCFKHGLNLIKLSQHLIIKMNYFSIKLYKKTIKGTVSVISSDPPCEDDNTRFTTILLKALLDQI